MEELTAIVMGQQEPYQNNSEYTYLNKSFETRVDPVLASRFPYFPAPLRKQTQETM